MHTATQIIAQRAPPASRTTKAARWQPYFALQTTASTSSLPLRSPHNTPPASSVSSPQLPPSSQTISSDINRSRPPFPTSTTQPPKENLQRDSSKQKFTSGLIDQTVQILSDIWHPQDVPACFLPPVVKTGVSPPTPSPLQSAIKALNSKERNSSLSLPPSSPTQPPSDLGQCLATPTPALALLVSEADSDQAMLPLKTFVHEVLRRSRTSGNVLQTALCYLEAIRPKVPEILEQENVGIRAGFQPESRIQPATPAELEREVELCALEAVSDPQSTIEDPLKTVRITDSGPDELDKSQQAFEDNELSYGLVMESSTPSFSLSPSLPTPFTALPSPLLCPRRAFLASLILASKFSQDKSYSNRAWAKLSGLPPREVGRCERALGQALEWRLWVGKTTIASQLDTPPLPNASRPVVRSQSEGSVTPNKPFLCEDVASSQTECPPEAQPHKVAVQVGLRRCSTLPAEHFGSSVFQPTYASKEDLGVDVISAESQQAYQALPPLVDTKGSPDPTTPGLSDSPSSTDCSDDRTIHMSDSTLDDNVFDGNFGKSWLGDSVCQTESPLAFVGSHCGFNSQVLHHPVSVVDIDSSTYGPNFYWNTDNYLILESPGVH